MKSQDTKADLIGGAGPADPTQAVAEVHCGSCGGLVGAGEQFCTSCGSPVSAARPDPPSTRLSGRVRGALAGLVVVAVALGAVVALEFVQHQREQSRLSRARHELTQTHATLAATKAQLARTKSLSLRQAAILAQTAVVLKKVDPLLSDADQLQQITGSIETARDAFAVDSKQMTADLIYLENYEANPQDYPYVNQYDLVAQVNSELQAVNADSANMTSYDGSFSSASTKFGNHANGFTTSVRQLQRELQKLGAQK